MAAMEGGQSDSSASSKRAADPASQDTGILGTTSTGAPDVRDIGADLFLEARHMPSERLEALDHQVRWKIDLIIMPLVATAHALQFLNKSSPNFVSALGIIPELGLGHGRYAWVGLPFLVSYHEPSCGLSCT